MGHRKSIVRQAADRLQSMAAYGQSKHVDKTVNGGKPARDKIYSVSTMHGYKSAAVQFVSWVRSEYGCRTLDEARQYTGVYLLGRQDSGLSAWTVRRDAAALAKLYQCKTTELGARLPKRQRKDITQHRTGAEKGHFSEEKNENLVKLCKSTGLRRHEVAALRPEDVYRGADGHVYVFVRQGKGGKARTVQAISEEPLKIACKARENRQGTVITHVPKYAPIHAYRREYAQNFYAQKARDVSMLPRAEIYYCRRDKKGTTYDKAAMLQVSQQLGHNRLDVVAASYLR